MKLKLSCLVIIFEIMRRKDGEAYSPKNMVPTVKFSGATIMIWGRISAKGERKISAIEDKMNA